jgi:hypothetical protein
MFRIQVMIGFLQIEHEERKQQQARELEENNARG